MCQSVTIVGFRWPNSSPLTWARDGFRYPAASSRAEHDFDAPLDLPFVRVVGAVRFRACGCAASLVHAMSSTSALASCASGGGRQSWLASVLRFRAMARHVSRSPIKPEGYTGPQVGG